MTDTRQLFSTPFVIDQLQSEAGIAALRQAIEAERVRDTAGISVSNIGGWHSNTRMLDWGGEAAKALVFKAMTMADEQTVDAKSPEGSRFGWIPELWANVNRKGHANQYHTHPGSFWSAVAYVDDGYEGDDDPALGGELQLLDPRMPMIRMTAPDLRLRDGSGQPMPSEVSIRPRTGMIVMFPSWLQHAVRPFHGEGTRISIAINLIPALKKPH
ncbi:2OG-Fe(II) oxygenase family protein [Aurantiacibacter sp. MUD11]|uniref:2OG-Fe(II) oxygenase family protein n=1 Tax=Aurantiacibacter sp. MUD11 TaxID=3003265 RepID=UPI0022AA0788|nr:2OG-Fe(II) oxygenase family protein [Aurantiacibacter sp. MUD11]WAT18215.1 2OG-Fe(II) oxygenase family protein [Aurantiacibacter sp. MUD11]